jgi:galactokinase
VVDPEGLARDFEAAFVRPPRLFRAPGRVNLIGEHTDYNDGFVMPIALDRYTWTASAPRADRTIVVRSREMGDTCAIDLDRIVPGRTGHWSDYVRGIAAMLDRGHNGRLRGADMLIASDVPIGAGLSSSAALEVACGCTLLALAGLPIDLTALALAAQRAEHEFAGTRCGIMDQMIACHGRAGRALLLDTRSLAADWLPLPPQIRVVIANTMVAHELASAEYNERRADCEAGVAILAVRFPGVRALRDATLEQLEVVRDAMPPRVYRRCRHVIAENARVIGAAASLRAGDFTRVGELMAESHRSLRDDYEVSCAELDAMALVISALRGVYGARMTGGGFGGSVVAIADAQVDEASMRVRIQDGYRART